MRASRRASRSLGRTALVLASAAWLLFACEPRSTERTGAAAWTDAERAWRERDERAYAAWCALDVNSAAGKQAHARLISADAAYRAAIAAFAAGDTREARAQFVRAAELGPMDPARYLPLARTYRDQGMPESAAKYFRKYLRARSGSERGQVERELAALELGPADVLEAPAAVHGADAPLAGMWIAAGAMLPLLGWLVFTRTRRTRAQRSLAHLIAHHPELHPAIAYLLASLRHELLKHRVAAVCDALERVSGTDARAADREFLRARLHGVGEAWHEHMAAFARELGHRLDVRRDPAFARAQSALLAIEQALPQLSDASALRRVRLQHAALLAFDAGLARLQQRLVRTAVDAALLRELVLQTYREPAVRGARIDDLECHGSGLPADVPVSRGDLLLILRNLLRNAVIAAASADAPRLVRVVASVELEPTGQEIMCIAVQDSSPAAPSPEQLAGADLTSGLGLALAAVRRYGGSLSVEPAPLPLRKQLCLRFLRVYEGATMDGAR